MAQVKITEVVLRDGHQSLIATRMRTEDMLPICDKLERAGFWSLEVWGGATFDACLRFLREDPWERLHRLREALPNSRLQMLLRGQNLLGYRHYSDDVVEAFVARAAAAGIDVFRIFDALNDERNMASSIRAVKASGKHAQGTLCYTVSPVHGIEQFTAMARRLEAMGCDSIAVKDMAGLLTPFRAAELIRALCDAVQVPVHLHMHATAGVAEMCQLKAIENGCLHIDTAISAFAGGASHPPTESMVAALADSDYDTGLDLELLQEIGFYFREVRRKYHQFESEGTGLDTRVQIYQVPGGMISNLYNQLREQGELGRIDEVLAEIPRVREDLGYPPLVTPTSQIVGTQAVMNVLTGERYKAITNEVKLYLQGRYGRAPGPVNPMVRQLAIGNEDVIETRPADLLSPEMHRLREEIGELARNEEDVLTYAMFPEVGREFLEQRAAGSLRPEPLEPPRARGEAQGRPTEFNVTLHGETYHVRLTGAGHGHEDKRPFYLTVDGVPEEVLVESLEEIEPAAEGGAVTAQPKGSRRPRASGPGDVTTSMPGTIVDVLVEVGSRVKAGDPLLVAEAMKMETEIQAPISGIVKAIHVAKGDSVNPDETLVEIEGD
ncbi:sodium-extruding oxaloacetate decarboxylase subunit alpha [Thiohalobacter sp. IOR34]|uniref:sodium-extruding oxaloacetate decarboxylase subunit alpha n=1 Tax=Thiohalobacter sp. IOR34 TaxID=3057176 RepID=UPI0025B0E0D9|nr:sodium-extruding oxaloacetate decarboxylase subunit alpha [Thiohalobacter sp. IOR34]WJW74241.1 sodium-extruding oxaloacetate decarboxylase subunit alpha [Thiohalobacter sp. IOR34]